MYSTDQPARRIRPLAALRMIVALALTGGCNAAPSRKEALLALHRASPGVESTTAYARVWQDGPPWFSCAEVISKLDGRADTAAVRDQVGNWRPLVLAGWLVLRDTARGAVRDPGWCAAKSTDEAARRTGGWTVVAGDSFPTGDRRRGWDVPIGQPRLIVTDAPRTVGRDSAKVAFARTVVPNANGTAMRVDRDSMHASALLLRENGEWRVVEVSPAGSSVHR
jgi:hypothetical protein